jgi:hypothetical protein
LYGRSSGSGIQKVTVPTDTAGSALSGSQVSSSPVSSTSLWGGKADITASWDTEKDLPSLMAVTYQCK